MRRFPGLLLAAVAVCAVSRPLFAQKFLPKTIQFKGDPDYSAQELMEAAGLKNGIVLDYAEMNAHSQQLLSSGMFATLAFKFDGQDLIFSLTPSTDTYPIHIDNLPLAPGTDVDTRLHAMLPLYHGKVPAQDGLMESVRAALEKILAEQGIHASVTATTMADVSTQRVNGIEYSIASPSVTIGAVSLTGVSPQFQGPVREALKTVTKLPFDSANTAPNLVQAVEQVYHDQGYAAAQVQATRSGAPTVSAAAIQVPFSVVVVEGHAYRLGAIHLPAGALMSPEELSKLTAAGKGAPSDGVRIRSVWYELAQDYKEKGYLDCKITPQAHLDEASSTVSYDVAIDPGAVYHMGLVKFANVSDQLNSLLLHYWTMMPGDVFNQTYVSQFIYAVQGQDQALKNSLVGVHPSFDATADPHAHTVNVVIRLSR